MHNSFGDWRARLNPIHPSGNQTPFHVLWGIHKMQARRTLHNSGR
jgi:hypothetical protein